MFNLTKLTNIAMLINDVTKFMKAVYQPMNITHQKIHRSFIFYFLL